MSFVKMRFICNEQPNNITLHCLYTSVRFLNEKEQKEDELFQIWNDGRSVFIVMDEDRIENKSKDFSFDIKDGKTIKIKLIGTEPLALEDFNVGDYVYFRGVLSYSHKYYNGENSKKFIESCPVNMKGSFKEGLKTSTFNYLEKVTGLDFNSEKDRNSIRFERIFTDEHNIYKGQIDKKILFKNIISIDATLKIKDLESFKKILKGSIGKKKSYGFGKFFIDKLSSENNSGENE